MITLGLYWMDVRYKRDAGILYVAAFIFDLMGIEAAASVLTRFLS